VKGTSVFGHAFVVLAFNDNQKKACVAKALGFFPEKDGDAIRSVFKDVPEKVSNDFLRNKPASGTCRLIVRVTKEQYDGVAKVLAQWGKKDYRLGQKDCVSFMIAVGNGLKLHIPERTGFDRLPVKYVQKLVENNGETEK
jgi:hypothetical protein